MHTTNLPHKRFCAGNTRGRLGTQTKPVPGLKKKKMREACSPFEIYPPTTSSIDTGRVMCRKPELLRLYSKDGRSKMTDGFPYDISLPNGRVVTAACDRDAASHANSASVENPPKADTRRPKKREIRVKFVGRMDPKEIKPHDVVTFSGNRPTPKRGRRYDTYKHVLHHAYVFDTDDETVTVRTIIYDDMPDKPEDQTADDWFAEQEKLLLIL